MENQAPAPKPNAGQGMGIAALILGIITIPFALFPCTSAFASVPAILAIIFGAVGLSQAKKGGASQGIPIAGLVLGILCAIFIAVWMTIFAEGYKATKDFANELESDTSFQKLDSILQQMDSTAKAADTLNK